MGISRQSADIERLLKSAPFPPFSGNFQFGFSADEVLLGESDLWPEQITALRARLKANPTATTKRFRLARLLVASEQDATQELARVVSETEAALRKSPQSAELLLQLGESLNLQKEHAKAEPALRRAAALAPKDWRILVALGDALYGQTMKRLADFDNLHQAPLKRTDRTSTQRVGILGQHSKAIHDCYNRAVALSPRHPIPRTRQLSHRLLGAEPFGKSVATLESTAPTATTRWMIDHMCSPEMSAALKLAIPYQSQSPRLPAVIAFLDFSRGMLLNPPASAESSTFANLPRETKEAVNYGIRSVSPFLNSPDRRLQGKALQSLAVLQYLKQDLAQSEKHILEAQKLGKLSQCTIDLMTIVYAQAEQLDKAEAFLTGILSTNPDRKNYQALVHIQFRQNRLSEGKKTLAVALKRYPDEPFFHLTLLTCGIRENQPAQIKESLANLAKHPVDTAPMNHHLLLLRGFLLALDGKTDEARATFQRFPDDDAAKEALTALGT
ncbi:MAG: hypothetical protein QM758_11830 [Armatimonas sp.]